MGLISKIEEKISGSSGSEEQSKLQKPAPEGGSSSNYTSGNTGNLTSSEGGVLSGNRTTGDTSGGSDQTRYPISSSGDRPTGTAVDNYGSTGTSSSRGDRGTIGMPGGYSSSGTTSNRVAQPTTTTTTTYDRPAGGGAAGTTSDVRYEPRSPYDPYSAKGQQTAANATTTRPTETMRPVGESRPVARDARPIAGQQYGPTGTTQPTSQTTSSHHYGRDAGIVGGAGAAGVGAYEMGKHSGTTSSGYAEPGMTSRAPIATQPPTSNVASQPSGAAYMDRDTLGGQQHQVQDRRPFVDDSAGMGGAGAMGSNTMGSGAVIGEESTEEKAKKMSDAYQAGYRDGVEHMRAEMQRTQLK